MSARYFEILRDSSHKGNYIPSGRQLPRTPPLGDVKRHLDFCSEDADEDCGGPRRDTEAGARGRGDNGQNGTFDFNASETKTENISEPSDPNSMLKGMKGYQLTPGDLEFIKKMKEEQLVKKLQGDLREVQRLLKTESMALELACASRDKAKAELNKFPSCEELAEWVRAALKMTPPSTELTDPDAKSLLALVTKGKVQRAVDEKRLELARMERMAENKKKKEAEERGQLEKQIAAEQLKIQGLMNQLSSLTSELTQQEEAFKALQMQIKNREEIKVGAEVEDSSAELQAAKSQEKHRGKKRRKAVKSTEKLLDSTNQSKSTRSKRADSKTDSQARVKDNHANKNTNESLKTSAAKPAKAKPEAATEKPAKSAKAARGPQEKVEEQESNSQEPAQAARGRRKPPGTAPTAAPRPKNHTKGETGEAQSTSQQAAPPRSRRKAATAPGDAGEEAQNAGLRRSKRIASKR